MDNQHLKKKQKNFRQSSLLLHFIVQAVACEQIYSVLYSEISTKDTIGFKEEYLLIILRYFFFLHKSIYVVGTH